MTLSRCYYHPRTASIITDGNLLDSDTLGRLMKMLPEQERYGLKYVTVCLGDGLAGKIDRDSLVSALEMFGQIRDSGVSPKDILREIEKKEIKIAPAVKATELTPAKGLSGQVRPDRKAGKKVRTRSPQERKGKNNGIR